MNKYVILQRIGNTSEWVTLGEREFQTKAEAINHLLNLEMSLFYAIDSDTYYSDGREFMIGLRVNSASAKFITRLQELGVKLGVVKPDESGGDK